MHQIVYVSTACWAMSDADLNEILDASRRNNRLQDVTGLLLHIDQGFLQVLEGPEPAVTETLAHIRRDPRHTALRVLIKQETGERLFGGWNMGFDRLSADCTRTAGAFAISQQAIRNAVPPEKAAHIATLLRNFYRVNAGQFAA